ncbi:MAG: hypothetical protein KF849_15410 [Rhizobiaceae bacterium]|nr:hypothetical protein [Rhizobiaceae bacterium]
MNLDLYWKVCEGARLLGAQLRSEIELDGGVDRPIGLNSNGLSIWLDINYSTGIICITRARLRDDDAWVKAHHIDRFALFPDILQLRLADMIDVRRGVVAAAVAAGPNEAFGHRYSLEEAIARLSPMARKHGGKRFESGR